MFKIKAPYIYPGGMTQVIGENRRRMVDVWMGIFLMSIDSQKSKGLYLNNVYLF